ncbi:MULTISPECIES: GNAT family N-acetyltransferase [unclassified Phenylobacterium]|uniref:GNAT family N-acetyltransferase n=1 Tax=unclassified Phenylobacterium TaxID=2640670 RepID=UPI00083AE229|nr:MULTISPECIES: GNAT family N-acetyltransferase [unclassified Phenylobacterium]
MQIDIRPCGPQDAGALALVGQATFLETYATVLPAADILAHCSHEHGEARYAAWLAQPGTYRFWAAGVAGLGAAVGYVMLCPPDLPVPTGPGDLEIKRIYLLSRFQGGGVGARLMATAIDAAKTLGARRVLLGVYGENASAIAFYARQGFAEAGVRKFQVGANTYDDLVLARAV